MRVTGLPSNSLVRKEIAKASSSSTSSSTQLIEQQENVMTSIGDDELDEIVTVGPFDEGSVVVVECNSLHGRPVPQVAWFNGTKLMSSKTVITPDSEEPRVTTALSFVLSRSDLTSQFSCRVWNNATVRPIIRWIAFDVHGELLFTDFPTVTHTFFYFLLFLFSFSLPLPYPLSYSPANSTHFNLVKPVSLHVRGPISSVVEGELVSLSCIVEDARPPANILWFNRSQPLDPQPLSSSDLLANGAFRQVFAFLFLEMYFLTFTFAFFLSAALL